MKIPSGYPPRHPGYQRDSQVQTHLKRLLRPRLLVNTRFNFFRWISPCQTLSARASSLSSTLSELRTCSSQQLPSSASPAKVVRKDKFAQALRKHSKARIATLWNALREMGTAVGQQVSTLLPNYPDCDLTNHQAELDRAILAEHHDQAIVLIAKWKKVRGGTATVSPEEFADFERIEEAADAAEDSAVSALRSVGFVLRLPQYSLVQTLCHRVREFASSPHVTRCVLRQRLRI